MTGRDALRASLVALVVLSLIPAYDRVFATGAWRIPALTAALAALVIAAVVRAIGGGAVASALASAVGAVALIPVLIGLTTRPTWPGTELLGALATRFSEGVTELQLTPAPAPLLAGIALFVVAGFWVVTFIAHELLVRWSRTGPSLIVLAVLWAAPLVVPLSDGAVRFHTVTFLAAGTLTLLMTTEHELPRPRLVSSGVSMGAFAIVIAVIAPGVLPGYQDDGWYGFGGGSSEPRGYQPIVDISQRLQLPEERDVLRVQSSQRSYLRLAGLDSFDGNTWRLGPIGEGSYRPDPASLFSASDLLPPEVAAASTESLFVDIEVLDLANIYVPTPYQPVQVLGPFRDDMVWSTDGGFLATWETEDGALNDDGPRVGITRGVEYRVQAERPVPTRDELLEVTVDEQTLATWTQLPREYPALVDQAEQIYAEAGATSTIDQVLALQEWFTGPGGDFTYDLDVPALRGDDALERFVIEDRIGYCEYFAAGMAVMLRATGIPARVATGFLPGDVVSQADPANGQDLTEYLVTTADAHAWVEVLFPGFGWITFEPTPRSDGAQIQPRADELAPLETEREREQREREEARADGVPAPTPETPQPDSPEFGDEGMPESDPEAVGGSESDEGQAGAWWIAAISVLVIGAVAGLLLLQARRRRAVAPDAAPAARRILLAQERIYTAALYCGLPRRPWETSLEVARRWQREGRVDASAMRFARLAQAAAFGGIVDETHAAQAEQLSREIIESLRASVGTRQRRAARWKVPWEDAKDRGRELLGTGSRR